jgi:phage shock protein PspC (stress-responsive transcriptional regulator)
MKKIEKVSIADISFTLDRDAYLSLQQYLTSIHDHYDKDPDGREITRDIEARIAELILGEQVYTKVVSQALIENIIAQLGSPEEIDGENSDTGGAGHEGHGPGKRFGRGSGTSSHGRGFGASSEGGIPRRVHRSEEGKIIGGVCSGLAKYVNISVAWVRIAFLFPAILGLIVVPFHSWWWQEFFNGWMWAFFVTYIVLWISLPMARTPRQKLEARGERITPESIRQNLQGSVNTPAGRKAASVTAELLTVVGRVVLFFVKFVMAVIGFSLLFAALIIFVCMISILFDPGLATIDGVGAMQIFEGMSILSPVMFAELALVCVLLPLFVIGLTLLAFTFSWRLGRGLFGVTLGLWGLSMLFFGIVAISNARFFRDTLPYRIETWDDTHHYHHEFRYDSDRNGWHRGRPDSNSDGNSDGWERREWSREEWEHRNDELRRQPDSLGVGDGDAPAGDAINAPSGEAINAPSDAVRR